MRERFTVTEYNLEWAIRDYNIHERPSPGTLSREEALAACGTFGVGGLELMHDYWQDRSPETVVRLADDAGIPIKTLIFFQDLAVPREERQSSVDQAKILIDRAQALGAGQCMIIPGIAKDEYVVDDQTQWMIEGLSMCCVHARHAGLTLMSENIDNPPSRPLMGTADQCVNICRQVASRNFRLIYDGAVCLLTGEDPLEALAKMLPYVAHVHLKNMKPVTVNETWQRTIADNSGCDYRAVRLDEGVLDFAAILSLLKAHDYAGDFLIEYQGEDNPCEATADCVAQAEAMLELAGL